jgi:hypothetical protein
MKRKSPASSIGDRETKRLAVDGSPHEEIGVVAFSLESYEDYGDDFEEPSPPTPPRQKPGPKPVCEFDAFAKQQQSTMAILMKQR